MTRREKIFSLIVSRLAKMSDLELAKTMAYHNGSVIYNMCSRKKKCCMIEATEDICARGISRFLSARVSEDREEGGKI